MDQLLFLMTGLGPKVSIRDLQCKTRGQLHLACTACSLSVCVWGDISIHEDKHIFGSGKRS